MTDYIVTIDENSKETQHVLAERLIRCKDCKNPQFGIDVVYCEVVGRFINQNDYCSWAERKDDA